LKFSISDAYTRFEIFKENRSKSIPTISKNRLEERSYFTSEKKKIVTFLKSSSKFSAFKGLEF